MEESNDFVVLPRSTALRLEAQNEQDEAVLLAALYPDGMKFTWAMLDDLPTREGLSDLVDLRGQMIISKHDGELMTRTNIDASLVEKVDGIRGSVRHVSMSPSLYDMRQLDAYLPRDMPDAN